MIFHEDFNDGTYLWQDSDWNYYSGEYYILYTQPNYLEVRYQAYPGSAGDTRADGFLNYEKPPKYAFQINCLLPVGHLGYTGFYTHTNANIIQYCGGIRMHRISATEVTLYTLIRHPGTGNAYWNYQGSLGNKTGWFNVSYTIDRTLYNSSLGYYVGAYTDIKIDGVPFSVQTNICECATTSLLGKQIEHIRVFGNGTASSWQYNPKFDDLYAEGIWDKKSKYTCFPRWQKTKYGLRPCY